ncbi:MAG: hypothetical protein ACC700_16810 [Anaerolineales bacterium]
MNEIRVAGQFDLSQPIEPVFETALLLVMILQAASLSQQIPIKETNDPALEGWRRRWKP